MATDRADYIAGLRELAARLESDDRLPLPHFGDGGEYTHLPIYTHSGVQWGALLDVFEDVRTPIEVCNDDRDDRDTTWEFVAPLDGLYVRVVAFEKAVRELSDAELSEAADEWEDQLAAADAQRAVTS